MQENKVTINVNKIIIATACIMILGIVIGTFIFEKSLEKTTIGPNPLAENHEIQGLDSSQPEPLQPIFEDNSVGYSLQNNQLQITFDNGENWRVVPVEKQQLVAGENNGSANELIENSYVLTKKRVSFLYFENGPNGSRIKLKSSLDQGRTWEDSVVTERYPFIRFRKVEFINDSFGYVIVSGDRTMSQEWTTVYITNDGGKQWRETAHSNVTRLIYNGGFVDENTGFLSFGILNPVEPDLYVTQDGGNSWSKATITIPEKYHEIFVMAEVPFWEGDHLAVYINQGPNGDYEGGKIKGKFLSNDQGKTWEFSMEAAPNETDD